MLATGGPTSSRCATKASCDLAPMSYELVAWPIDRAMSAEEAIAQIRERTSRWPVGIGRDRRIKAFAAAMDEAFPGIGSMASPIPMEFDVHRDWVHMALPWSMVADLVRTISPLAYDAGLALYDPQRDEVALPQPFGGAPLGVAGVEEHERMAATAMNAIIGGLDVPDGVSPIDGVNQSLRDVGFTLESPLGFTITPEIQAEAFADPTRVPSSLQTAERKRQLLEELRDSHASRRFAALQMLGGWDSDPDVAAALRAQLASDDMTTVGLAATALARQREVADLPALIETVHRMSPADGGTIESMLLPLSGAFELARLVGPEAVSDLEANARAWAQPSNGARRRSPISERDFEQMLDAMKSGPRDFQTGA